jgi:hypothetical protein
MMDFGKAFQLACCIYGYEEGNNIEDMAEALQLAVGVVLIDITDEAKADLYSLLAEQLTADTKFTKAVSIIDDALIKNKRRYPHG